uniref:Uncharacterized protein n=1 Tax=Oryza sativa subsp. japonica TaxID=39947 RepID=Q6YUC9_ORYSJ|nr:hypothetical protein [Oryza sativa Japonica Group]BAD03898.1 hypothetical protein [Oryza sativa Japonica Group]
MVNTHASGSGNNNNEENPTLAQVLAQQTQLINMLVQQMQNQQGNSGCVSNVTSQGTLQESVRSRSISSRKPFRISGRDSL